MSTPPPAVRGTMSLIGRLGQASCADDAALAPTISASTPRHLGRRPHAERRRLDRQRVLRSKSIVFLPGGGGVCRAVVMRHTYDFVARACAKPCPAASSRPLSQQEESCPS